MQKTDARHSATAGESKLHFLDYWRVVRVRFGIVLLSFLLVVITAAVVTYFMPKKYKTSIMMELRMDTTKPSPFRDSNGQPTMDPRFVNTETERIKSHLTLDPVIDTQDLPRKWGSDGNAVPRDVAFYKLRSMLDLRQVRGTDLVELFVTSTSPSEAASLAAAVAEAYKNARQEDIRGDSDKFIVVMTENLREKEQAVDALQTKLADFRRAHPELRFTDPDGRQPINDPYQTEIDTLQADVNRFTNKISSDSSQLSQIEKLKGDELMRALTRLELPDPTVSTILPKWQEANSEEKGLLNLGLGPNHPRIKKLVAEREVYAKQLTEQIDSIRHSLAIQLKISQDTVKTISERLIKLRETQRLARVATTDYQKINEDYAQARAILETAQVQSEKEKMSGRIPLVPTKILNPPEEPKSPSSPRIPLNMAIGVLIGLIVGVGLAFFIEYLDTSVKTMEDVETMLGVPVLAIVPKNIKLLHKQPTDVPDAEAYRILRTNIEFNRKSADANTISMVSGGPGEGKSTTLCNLAFTCAQGGYSVLIVDADLRRPTQHKLFEVNNNIGLTNYLTTNIALDDVIIPTPVENLSLMPSGILPADAVGILNSQRMSDMIAELKTRYDIIFFDSPPILGVSDGAVLASEVDQSIIIVQHRRFPRAMLMRVKQAINNVGGTVLGVVLNNVDLRHDPNYAYYTSYYEYYAVRTPKDVTVASISGGKRGGSGPSAVPAEAGAGSSRRSGTAKNGNNSPSSEY